jgi:TRAP transporter TAXI family solute receptor
LAVLAAVLLATPAAAQQEAAEPAPAASSEIVDLGTGSVTGVYFPVGVALCRLANQHRRETGLRCAARPSAGSVANIEGLRDGRFGLALVQSDIQAAARDGAGPFAEAGPLDGLTAVMALYPEPLTLVARADAGIARVEDLAGKRVWIGAAGSGTRPLANALMGALGWGASSFEATPEIAPDRLGQALCSGAIDAFLYAVGHPALVVQEATTACDARLVPIEGGAVDELVRANPAYVAATIPGELYRGNPEPVASFGVTATVVARPDIADDTVGTIVRAVVENLDMLRGLDPALAGLEPAAMVSHGLTAPLQPGAAAVYRERGWID